MTLTARLSNIVLFASAAWIAAGACGKKEEGPPRATSAPPAATATEVAAEPEPSPPLAQPPAAATEPDAAAAAEPVAEPARDAAGPEVVLPAPFATETFTAGDLTVESIRVCEGVESRECSGEIRTFAPGQMVWALLRLSTTQPAERSILVSYVPAGTEPGPGKGLRLSIPAQRGYTTFAKASKQEPGRYEIVVRTEQDELLARAEFEVASETSLPVPDAGIVAEPVLSPAAPAPAPFVPSGSFPTTTLTAGDLSVEWIRLCAAVENRDCVGETRTFAPGQMVWVLLRLSTSQPAERSILVSYVGESEEPAPDRGLRLTMPAQRSYTTFSKASKPTPGRYQVVVRTEGNDVIARAAFEVVAATP